MRLGEPPGAQASSKFPDGRGFSSCPGPAVPSCDRCSRLCRNRRTPGRGGGLPGRIPFADGRAEPPTAAPGTGERDPLRTTARSHRARCRPEAPAPLPRVLCDGAAATGHPTSPRQRGPQTSDARTARRCARGARNFPGPRVPGAAPDARGATCVEPPSIVPLSRLRS